MNEFEQLKNNWNAQLFDEPSSSDYSALKNKIKGIAKKQRITNVVLVLTIAVLVLFFMYIGAIHFIPIAFALAAMILILVIRIWIEVVSITRLKKIVGVANVQNFKENLKKYYKNTYGFAKGLIDIKLEGEINDEESEAIALANYFEAK